MPGLLHVAVVRSPMAHARITRVDVSAALDRPGVVAAFSGADLTNELGTLPCAWPVTRTWSTPTTTRSRSTRSGTSARPSPWWWPATGTAAADAVEAVEVDDDPLPAVTDMEEALKDEVLVHSDKGTNKSFLWPFDGGDYDAAKAGQVRGRSSSSGGSSSSG